MRTRARDYEWAIAALILLAAGALRLFQLGRVLPDPFYDAAVRSMGLSWHNFYLGAFEPGGSVSIDKPPVDLWLQVASVKLLGFNWTTLKLPEALAAIAAVGLLFVAVKRMWSVPAGLAAAAALAVLPVEVITARSDTMDGVMMALCVLALLLIVRACESGAIGWLLAAAASLGLAFDVKLLESLVAVPGLVLMAYLGLPGTRRRRLLALLAAGAVYVAVALSWLTSTLIFPAHERPFAIGSTNGSAWNAAFVFNGTDRLGGKSPEPQFTVYEPGHHYPEATQSERDHIPIVPASPTRLLARIGPLSGQRLGLELLVALLLGVPALWFGTRARREDAEVGDAEADAQHSSLRLRRAAAAGIGLWMATGIALFSAMSRLHPRYVEAFTPAVAVMLGIGVAWVAPARGRTRMIALLITLAAVVYYVERLLYGTHVVWWITLVGALGAGALALAIALRGPEAGARQTALAGAVGTLILLATLALPVSVDFRSISDRISDAGFVGALPGEEQRLLSAYLRAHQGKARYELAAESATQIGSLIVQDARPVVVLTTYNGRVFTPVTRLRALIAAGAVKYAFLNSFCGRRAAALNAACAEPVLWIRAHGTDVSRKAGLARNGVLWLLPGARP